MASFIFGGNTGVSSPQELARRRQIVDALASRMLSGGSAPTSVSSAIGQGLGDLGEALAVRRMDKGIDAAQKAGDASAKSAWGNLLASIGSGGTFPAMPTAPASASDPIDARVSQAFSGDKQKFFGTLTPAAIKASQATGVDPRIILAQAALESGYGQHAPGNNFFGIKGPGQNLDTTEVVNGKPVSTQADFRTYDSPDASVMGYADFINNNPRYAAFKAADGLDAQAQALGQSGYATDPNYGQKVLQIAKGIDLPTVDVPKGPRVDAEATGSLPAPDLPPPVDVTTPPSPPEQAQFAGSQQLAQATGGIVPTLKGERGPAPQQQTGPSLQVLMQAASNPFLNETQRAVVLTMLKNRLDPNAGLERRYKEAQIAHLSHPDLPANVQEYNYGQTHPGYDAWRLAGKKAGATNITLPGQPAIGTIPQGYAAYQDPQTGQWSMRPIPGGPAAAKVENANQTQEKSATQQLRSGNIVLQDIGRMEKVVKNAPWYSPATGFGAGWLQNVGGTNAANTSALASTIGANIGFDRLQRMREESPTGGALGQISDRENTLLQSVLGSISQSQSEDQLLQNLERLKQVYTGFIHTMTTQYPDAAKKYGFYSPGIGKSDGSDGVVDYRDYFKP